MIWILLIGLSLCCGVKGQSGVPPVGGEYNDQSNDKSYRFGFQTGDDGNHYHAAVASKENRVAGRFGSRDPASGRVIETQYTAGERGFRARGPNIARKMDLSQNKIPYNPPVNPNSPDYNPTLDGYHDPNEDPSYSFGFRTPSYTRQENADSNGHVNGAYSFVDDVGERHDVSYEAGARTGFNVKTPFPDSKPFTGTFYQGPPSSPGGKTSRGKTSIQQRGDGSYRFVAAGPDQRRTEVSDAGGRVRGSYSYIDDKGQQRTVDYIAGPNIGYRIVNKGIGANFSPVPTFIPPTRFPDFSTTPSPPFSSTFPDFPLDAFDIGGGDFFSSTERPGSSTRPGGSGSPGGSSGSGGSSGFGGSSGTGGSSGFGGSSGSGGSSRPGGSSGSAGSSGFGGSSRPGGSSGSGGSSGFGGSSRPGGSSGSGGSSGFGGSSRPGGSSSGGQNWPGSGGDDSSKEPDWNNDNGFNVGDGTPTSTSRPGSSFSTPWPTSSPFPSSLNPYEDPDNFLTSPSPTPGGSGYPSTTTSKPTGYPSGRPPPGSPSFPTPTPYPNCCNKPFQSTPRPSPDYPLSAFPEDDPTRPQRPLYGSLEDDFLKKPFAELPHKLYDFDYYKPSRPQYSRKTDSDFLSSNKNVHKFPSGVAVRAHVQSLDIVPYGAKIPPPGYALEHNLSHKNRK